MGKEICSCICARIMHSLQITSSFAILVGGAVYFSQQLHLSFRRRFRCVTHTSGTGVTELC